MPEPATTSLNLPFDNLGDELGGDKNVQLVSYSVHCIKGWLSCQNEN